MISAPHSNLRRPLCMHLKNPLTIAEERSAPYELYQEMNMVKDKTGTLVFLASPTQDNSTVSSLREVQGSILGNMSRLVEDWDTVKVARPMPLIALPWPRRDSFRFSRRAESVSMCIPVVGRSRENIQCRSGTFKSCRTVNKAPSSIIELRSRDTRTVLDE